MKDDRIKIIFYFLYFNLMFKTCCFIRTCLNTHYYLNFYTLVISFKAKYAHSLYRDSIAKQIGVGSLCAKIVFALLDNREIRFLLARNIQGKKHYRVFLTRTTYTNIF